MWTPIWQNKSVYKLKNTDFWNSSICCTNSEEEQMSWESFVEDGLVESFDEEMT